MAPNEVLQETGLPPRQIFEGYVDAPGPTLVTADLLVDAYCGLQGRLVTELSRDVAPTLGRLVECIRDVAVRERSTVLAELAHVCTRMLEDPDASLAVLLRDCERLQTCLPASLGSGLDGAMWPSYELRGHMRMRKLLQSVRFADVADDHAVAMGALLASDAVRECTKAITIPFIPVFGEPRRSIWSDRVPSDRQPVDGSWLLPGFSAPLGGLWCASSEATASMALLGQGDGAVSHGMVAPSMWRSWRTVAGAESSALRHFCDALAALEEPDKPDLAPFCSPAWKTVHGGSQLAALVVCERQMYALSEWRVRGIAGNQDTPFVVPFSKVFLHLAEAASLLKTAAVVCQDGKNRAMLLEDIELFRKTCAMLVEVVAKQCSRRPLTDQEHDSLAGIGRTAAQMHGYRRDSVLVPRDDHAFHIALGDLGDGSVMRAGVGRPHVLYVRVRRGGEDVVHRGVVYSYVEGVVKPGGSVAVMTTPSCLQAAWRQ